MSDTTPDLTTVERLTRDLKKAAATLTDEEARYLVDAYYMMQRDRIRSDNQVKALSENEEPHAVVSWLANQAGTIERSIIRALDAYTDASVQGQWAKSICGIGPVLSAGLAAHIDITKAPTVGHIWRFGGYDPTVTWAKKQKRPWNASLKTLFWKIGESFVKVSGNEKDVYGKLYVQRRAYEDQQNDAGILQPQAVAGALRVGKSTEAYKHYVQGKLPPGHLHARAKRWTVKLFLAHYHAVAYRAHYSTDAPKPYVFTQLGHAHEMPVPNWPF